MTEINEDGCLAGNTTPPETVELPEPMEDEEFEPFGYEPDRDAQEITLDQLQEAGE